MADGNWKFQVLETTRGLPHWTVVCHNTDTDHYLSLDLSAWNTRPFPLAWRSSVEEFHGDGGYEQFVEKHAYKVHKWPNDGWTPTRRFSRAKLLEIAQESDGFCAYNPLLRNCQDWACGFLKRVGHECDAKLVSPIPHHRTVWPIHGAESSMAFPLEPEEQEQEEQTSCRQEEQEQEELTSCRVEEQERQEQEEQERQEQECREKERQEQWCQELEQERKEKQRQKQESKGQERQEQERQKQEQERQEKERQEQERQKQERKEQEHQEQERNEKERQEQERQKEKSGLQEQRMAKEDNQEIHRRADKAQARVEDNECQDLQNQIDRLARSGKHKEANEKRSALDSKRSQISVQRIARRQHASVIGSEIQSLSNQEVKVSNQLRGLEAQMKTKEAKRIRL